MSNEVLYVMECPVCNEYMEPPIRICYNGHSICEKCKTKLKCCPSCAAIFIDARNYALEELAEIFQHPCKYGCPTKGKYKAVRQHEENCSLRNDRECALSNCSWKGTWEDMQIHLEEAHEDMLSYPKIIDFDSLLEPRSREKTITLIPYKTERFRLVYCRLLSDVFYLWVEYIGNSEKAKDFDYTLQFSNTRKCVKYSAECLGFNSTYESGFMVNKNVLKLPFNYSVNASSMGTEPRLENQYNNTSAFGSARRPRQPQRHAVQASSREATPHRNLGSPRPRRNSSQGRPSRRSSSRHARI